MYKGALIPEAADISAASDWYWPCTFSSFEYDCHSKKRPNGKDSTSYESHLLN